MKTKNKKPSTPTRKVRKDAYSEEDKKIACSDLPIVEIARKLNRYKADRTPNENVILQLRTKLKSEGYDVKKTRSWSRKNTEQEQIALPETKTSKEFRFLVNGVEVKVLPGVKLIEVGANGVKVEI